MNILCVISEKSRNTHNTHIFVNCNLLTETECLHQTFLPHEKIQEMIADYAAVDELEDCVIFSMSQNILWYGNNGEIACNHFLCNFHHVNIFLNSS
jgi:hypothetical protein